MPIAAAIIVAAGHGTRLGAPGKVLMPLAGRPLLAYGLDAAEAAVSIHEVIVVAGLHTKAQVEALIDRGGWRKVSHVALGGDRRQDSVEAGLRLVHPDTDIVAVHDGARPLVTPRHFDDCVAAAARVGAAIAAAPVVDTLKRVRNAEIVETVDRDGLWAAQTPQAVTAELLRASFAYAHAHRLEVTDEAGLIEARGLPVALVSSSAENLKVTRPEDVLLAEAILRARAQTQAARR